MTVSAKGSDAAAGAVMPAPGVHALPGGVRFHRWLPVTPARAVVLIVHGLGEHAARYEALAGSLTAVGFCVFAPDHRGHGLSPGRRAHIDRFGRYFEPLDELLALVRRDHADLPRFLVGHSMGGLIAACYLLRTQQDFRGAVLSGAALAVPEPPGAFALWFNRMLARLWPTLGVMQLDASAISRDPGVVAAYEADPLVHHGRISARLVVELFDAMGEVAARRSELRLPLLVMHGEADRLTAPEGSRQFIDGVGSRDRELKLYRSLYHEIFNEPERERVIGDALGWLQARCAGAAST